MTCHLKRKYKSCFYFFVEILVEIVIQINQWCNIYIVSQFKYAFQLMASPNINPTELWDLMIFALFR